MYPLLEADILSVFLWFFFHLLPEFGQCFFLEAGYIGPADAASGCNFALGTWPLPVQTVSKRDDLGFPLTQSMLHALAYLSAGISGIQGFQHIVIDADHVQ